MLRFINAEGKEMDGNYYVTRSGEVYDPTIKMIVDGARWEEVPRTATIVRVEHPVDFKDLIKYLNMWVHAYDKTINISIKGREA